MDQRLLTEINAAYHRLGMKQAEILQAMLLEHLESESGWYNGHYHKNDRGDWRRDSYPIP